MRLAEYTDYALRVLMYCATNAGRLVTVAELAEHHGLSKNHLMKIVSHLANQGVLETIRGRGGGLRLLMPPEQIRVGDIVRRSETDFRLVECFDSRTNTCSLTPTCRLKPLFERALAAYLHELDGATLADLTVAPPRSANAVPPHGPRPAASGAGAGGAGAGSAHVLARVAMPVSRRSGPGRREDTTTRGSPGKRARKI